MAMKYATDLKDKNQEPQRRLRQASERRLAALMRDDTGHRCDTTKAGFTVIEIVAILILIGIISAVALSRIGSTQSYSLAAEVDIMKTHLRYVHLRALSDNRPWGVSFTGTSYTMLRDGAVAPYNLPNESSATHVLPQGLTIAGGSVTFDEWGSPGPDDIDIDISGGGTTVTVTITRITGFIP